MKNIYYLLLILTTIYSCKHNSKEKSYQTIRISNEKYIDKLIAHNDDTLYTKNLIDINYGKDVKEELEIYLSKYDTIMNQSKIYNKTKIDKESEYYDLEIWNTEKPHIYRGKVTIHTAYENLTLNKQNRRTLEFAFCEQTKDSMSLKYITSKTSNTIDFEFENYFGNRLQGKLNQLVYRDTIVKGKAMLNMRQTELLVDNYPTTVNIFLNSTSSIKKKKFNPKKFKLKPGK
jgi:hypothetical protein